MRYRKLRSNLHVCLLSLSLSLSLSELAGETRETNKDWRKKAPPACEHKEFAPKRWGQRRSVNTVISCDMRCLPLIRRSAETSENVTLP